MKILIVGNGGREHAILEQVLRSKKVDHIFIAPGNGGTASKAQNIAIVADDLPTLLRFAKDNSVDLTIVGPELPLTLGITDLFQKENLTIFGPSQKASVVEGSKIFTKTFCAEHNIPTADFKIFDKPGMAIGFLRQKNKFPIVIKADGLAAGKGVIIANSLEEGIQTIEEMMVSEKFGSAGKKIIIEDFLTGEEASFIVVSDGENFVELPPSQDHKRLFDKDEGPNTGGMGAYSPPPVVTEAIKEKVRQKIIIPTLNGLKKQGRKYVGFLYAGLMILEQEPFLIEYNCRLGDPEAQVILPRLRSDFLEMIDHALHGTLDRYKIEFEKKACAGIVLASKGYPGVCEKNLPIMGLNAAWDPDISIFHAGTQKTGDRFFTNGGRVLTVSAKGIDLKSAIQKAYSAVAKITFPGMHYRKDIGAKGLKHG